MCSWIVNRYFVVLFVVCSKDMQIRWSRDHGGGVNRLRSCLLDFIIATRCYIATINSLDFFALSLISSSWSRKYYFEKAHHLLFSFPLLIVALLLLPLLVVLYDMHIQSSLSMCLYSYFLCFCLPLLVEQEVEEEEKVDFL